MHHDNYTTDDQIAACGGAGGFADCSGCNRALFLQVFPSRLHPTPGFRLVGPEDLSQVRLSRPDAVPEGFQRTAARPELGKSAALFHPLQSPPAAAKKGEPVFLLVAATVRAQEG